MSSLILSHIGLFWSFILSINLFSYLDMTFLTSIFYVAVYLDASFFLLSYLDRKEHSLLSKLPPEV